MTTDRAVLARMDEYLDTWVQRDDPRRVFLQCYRAMTGNMLAAVDKGFFEDPIWVNDLLHHFADYYFNALHCHECGEVTPKVWQDVYERSMEGPLHPMQLLMMGVNAHINYDLVFALRDMLKDEWPQANAAGRLLRKSDHMKVNQVIASTIDQVQDEVIEPGHPMMAILDRLMGRLDEYLLSQLIAGWRSDVWENAMQLLQCEPSGEEEVRQRIENATLHIGERLGMRW